MHIKRFVKDTVTKESVGEIVDGCLEFPGRRWRRLKRSWREHGKAPGRKSDRLSAFWYWLWHDFLGEVILLWTLIIFVVIPTACFFEWKARKRLVEGKMYRVGGEKFILPFIKDKGDQHPFKIEAESCSLHDTRTGETDHRHYRYINSGDVLVLVRAQEGELGTWEDEGEWIFLHPTGCLVSLNWDSHRLLLWTLRRLEKPKSNKKS